MFTCPGNHVIYVFSFESIPRFFRIRTRSTKEVLLAPKNFLVSPPKRGGPGVPGVLLSHKSKDQIGIVSYANEPYDADADRKRVRAFMFAH